MLDSDKEKFKALMMGVGELYSKEITKPLMRIYFSALINYSFDEVEQGINSHTLDPNQGSFFPKPADIVRNLQKSILSAEERAEVAWAEIERKIRSVGSYGALKLEDGIALAALRGFTSWKDLCSMDTSKMTWAKKEFISLYSTYDKAPIESLPKSLPGRIELEQQKALNQGYLSNLKQGMEDFKKKLDKKEL